MSCRGAPTDAMWKEIIETVRKHKYRNFSLDLSHAPDPPKPLTGGINKWAAVVDKWVANNGRKIVK